MRIATGRYRYQELHWHAFSFDLVTAQDGRTAFDAYSRVTAESVIVIPEVWTRRCCGVRCSGEGVPDLTDYCDDLYVFPESLAWSMVFTHEQPDFGPYFVDP
ncbi:MAG: DUF4275 family protein [Planctomycetota bacterium]